MATTFAFSTNDVINPVGARRTTERFSKLALVANDRIARKRASHDAGSWSGQRDPRADCLATADCWRTEALEELWRTHEKKLLRITQRITRNHEDAEDALQDSFLSAFVHLEDFDGRSSLSTWLTRIAINSALMLIRKKGSARAARELSIDDRGDDGRNPEVEALFHPAPGPEAYCAQREREAFLRDALRDLPPSMRRVIELQKLQEHSLKETAQVMKISEAAAKTHLHRAKASLREALRPRLRPRASGTNRFRAFTASAIPT